MFTQGYSGHRTCACTALESATQMNFPSSFVRSAPSFAAFSALLCSFRAKLREKVIGVRKSSTG